MPNSTIKDRFISLCELNNKKKSQVEFALGLSRDAHRKWNVSVPNAETVAKLAKYFGVSEQYILTGEENSGYYQNPEVAAIAQEVYERPEMKVLFDASRNVSKEDIEFVVQMLEKMKNK